MRRFAIMLSLGALLALGTVPLRAQNLLTSPLDITNAAWTSSGSGTCTKTSATLWSTSGAGTCSLFQTVSVTPNKKYTIQLLVHLASGSAQNVYLTLYTPGFVTQCTKATLLSATVTLLNCTGNSGANSSLIWELDEDGGVTSGISVSYAMMSLQYPWSFGYYTPYGTGSYPSLADLDMTALTHIGMVCGNVNADGSVTLYTGFAAAATTLISTAHAVGVKVLFDLGGCVSSSHFNTAIANQESTLITNIMSTVNTYGFDGVDVDNEETWNAAHMTTFLGDLRTNLGTKLLTFPSGDYNYQKWDASHAAYMDRVFIQTYDLGGQGGNPYSWFNSPFNTPSDNCCDSVSFDTALFRNNSKVADSNLGIGIPFYGVASTGASQTGPYQAFVGTATLQQHYYNYIIQNFNISAAVVDSIAMVPWIPITNGWMNWDNPQSVTVKVNYALAQSLGGWIIWDLYMDYFPLQSPPHPLLAAIKAAMVGSIGSRMTANSKQSANVSIQ